MDTIITILLFIGGALFYSRMKKKEESEADTWLDSFPKPGGSVPPSVRPPPEIRAQRPAPESPPVERLPESIEELLRRALNMPDPPPRRSASPPAPPPPFVEEPAPRPTFTPRPVSARRPPPVPVPAVVDEQDIGLPVKMPSLSESSRAYEKAGRLEATVADRFRAVNARVSAHRGTKDEKRTPPEVSQALAMLRSPVAIRTAFVTSVVLGLPKSLEKLDG